MREREGCREKQGKALRRGAEERRLLGGGGGGNKKKTPNHIERIIE